MVAAPGGEFQESFSLIGHQDWVRSVRFQPVNVDGTHTELLLASASQDKTIRIWRATCLSSVGGQVPHDSSLLSEITKLASKHSFSVGTHIFSVALEAVLVGHEDWIHSLSWEPCDMPSRDRLRLLSTCMDRTMMLWRSDVDEAGVWMSEESVGDAGSNALGYFGGVFSPCGKCIIAHGFSGALHLWERDDLGQWQPRQALGGHFSSVVDCCWVLGGDALISASADQTVRVTTCANSQWYELARPQVHGHNLSCISPLSMEDSSVITSFRYISGSEEKVLRVFQAPVAFAASIQLAHGQQISAEDQAAEGVAVGASLAALGLSNKALYASEEIVEAEGHRGAETTCYDDGPDAKLRPEPCALERPPFEEELAQNTLWPEIRKLFGHGNDIISLAADPMGIHLASACRAQNAATATIRVWSTKDWSAVAELKSHMLTVTAMEYSPSGRYLLSASRDRSFSLFERLLESDPQEYRLLHRHAKAHDRILWDVSWAVTSDLFATCSRDKTVKIWSFAPHASAEEREDLSAGKDPILACQHTFKVGVVSVAFLQEPTGNTHTLAIGFEDGAIVLCMLLDRMSLRLVWESTTHAAHCAPVKQLCWTQAASPAQASHPSATGDPTTASVASWGSHRLASCGEDNKLRVFRVLSNFIQEGQ
mmetsp:Transcript_27111/g.76510  ORF Transcript_27111/g.76510 Transcript_27111/m.76510 type:complete len:653 (+) Transcript_27111:1034-2992(+)